MLFETYFNNEGMFRYDDANIEYLEVHLKWIGRKELACSFDFIERVLKPFEQNILFMPSKNPHVETINIHIESDIIARPWGEEKVERILSMNHDNKDLLDPDKTPTCSGIYDIMSFESLRSIISKNFCIPKGRLQIITNKPECKENYYLSVGLKKLQDLH